MRGTSVLSGAVFTMILVGFFMMSSTAHACSPLTKFIPDTEKGILLKSGGVTLVEILEDGEVVKGKVLKSTFDLPEFVTYRIEHHSCSNRLEEYSKGEFMVDVDSRDLSLKDELNFVDGIFDRSFNDLESAELRYEELADIANNRNFFKKSTHKTQQVLSRIFKPISRLFK